MSSNTVRTARRRTLRMAALALTAAAGLTLTACSGSDAAGTKPAGQSDKAAAVESGGAGSSAGAQGSGAPASPGAKADTKSGAAGKQSGGAHATNGGKAASPVRTQRLADGVSTAEISKVGDQHYRAKIVARGSVLATLEAKGQDAGLDANDMFLVLTSDGQVRSWMGGGHQGPGTFKIAGGWTVKVTKVGELHYRAQFLSPSGDADDTVEANQHDIGFVANGVNVVLSAGGVISAHS
ncbi:hypothetical protein SLV14_004849 [Streptomyces sp. Je 1-4]|uniref:hypothetical protein n=1 Tax=Streptomyces TaxID=1883 RepID=UPI0021D7FA21|nr:MULTISPECIES: hypothetical protein [unclassified Streptomyces]UYB42026.1 hypothetical protein SLV14_004849 [Streptomyces sp. Je 1-4]UZQ38304.1 hypothetical protein SLV14N_004849 [Streptomyces sp. Je 1-4] [Streptomyces sp. Je 1-4 4N24]UZQ45721.1 hypothetical protein SLV14NA_004849 [Streptomyces sp. Je 1-4] [Streptomyces sp. Je 1-4 4N24_ara]